MTSTSERFIGDVIDNRYMVVRKIADGGMASVYEGVDQRLNKRVAIKIMHTSLMLSAHSEQYTERFHREALSAAALDNPHIVYVFDAGNVEGLGYIVMEYVDGVNLRHVMQQHPYFTVRDTINIMIQVLDGLSSAHEHSIIHRDIKPENIMINKRNEVQIADFGLAKHTNHATVAPTNTIMGTTTYIAPETAQNNTSTPASDLYSVGLIMWEMLTGHTPFESDNPLTVVYKHVNEDVPDLCNVAPSLPVSISAFVARLTARNINLRPQTATEALAQLYTVKSALSEADLSVKLNNALFHPALSTGTVTAAKISDDTQSMQPLADSAASSPISPKKKPKTVSSGPNTPRTSHLSRALTWATTHRTMTAVAAAVLVILLIAGSVTLWDNYGPGSYDLLPAASDVPCTAQSVCTVEGADADAYQKQLDDAGISYTVEKSYSDTIESGKIISTLPSTVGSHVPKKNGKVSITVSTGIEKITIPSDITNSNSVNGKDPLKALKTAGFTNINHSDAADEYSTDVPQGAIISINPRAGSTIEHNTEISVVLSKGLKPVTMPNVTGLSRGDALTALNALRLKVTITEEYSSTMEAGKVISQSVADGAELHWNDAVTLTVSKGSKTVTVPDVRGMTTARAQTTLEDLGFKVTIQKKGGDSIASQSLDPGEIVSIIDSKGNPTKITLTTTRSS
ncbi:Stk1 family PASTA domain-containing Ser/Thr kinase [Alloscardovia criceti]|uniref:Stk1 family PASTA domain-containing Ser/Thr kinase n=1 Tax=Alloscardovia criceti TaxID=356828 RepID=UPI00035F9FEE|nr:Stk1 family PASTA domain-containing Ser/Thr kinase [Alloscardovia criceti]